MTKAEVEKKIRNIRYAKMQVFRKTHRDNINSLPSAQRHYLIRSLKQPLVALLLFFLSLSSISTGICFGDTSARVHDYVAAVIETERDYDSTDAADLFLVPFEKDIRAIAKKYKLPPSLLAAFIQEESAFSQWATRTEPHYKKKKIVIAQARAWTKSHRGLPTYYTELDDRSRSYGLMQVMGQLAREQGFDAKYLPELFLPFNSIEQGAIALKNKLSRYKGDTLSSISAYNQGNNRMKHGRFENFRYVYRVGIAWREYEKLFIKTTSHELRKTDPRSIDSLRDRIRSWQDRRMFGMQPIADTSGWRYVKNAYRNPFGTRTSRQRDRADFDTTAGGFFISPDTSDGEEILITEYHSTKSGFGMGFAITLGFIALSRFSWLFLARHEPSVAGHDRSVLFPFNASIRSDASVWREATIRETAVHVAGLNHNRP